MRTDYGARCARSYALDVAAAESTRQLMAFERPPYYPEDFALLRRWDRLARLRGEG
jgi:hypothetical protein